MRDIIQGEYFGQAKQLFGLHIRTSLLTLLTLGFYRFWAKTRIRKYVWSATSGDGDSFEYTGTGLEKFLGFLLAVVFLAIYLGLLQLVLTFFGLSLISEAETDAEMGLQFATSNLSLLAVLPLVFFAQYRARRYRMARTRWRGLRFGMDSAALGYVGRALVHWTLTIVTLGLLLPRQSFYLEKYMTDRTWFGDARFHQEGRWQDLYRGMKHLFIGAGFFILGGLIAASNTTPGLVLFVFTVGYVWLVVGWAYYRVYTLNYMISHKVCDGTIRFKSETKLGDVIQIILVGGLVLLGALFVVGGVVAGVIFALIFNLVPQIGLAPEALEIADFILPSIVSVLGYLILLLVLSGISLVLITQKIVAHVVQHVTILNASHLDELHQRAGDKGADAEGFADALDVGGAF